MANISDDQTTHGGIVHYDDSRGLIVMTVTDMKQLIISQNSVIFESHSLVNARSYIRGLTRNDSLLFMYKFKAETRRMRVRFCKDGSMSGMEVCIMAVKKLSTFFPIKASVIENGAADNTQLDDKTKEKHSDLVQSQPKISNVDVKSSTDFCGEVTLGAVAQAVLSSRPLPLAYHQHLENSDMIPQLLAVCLGDPTFPAFVEAVETALRAVVNDSL